MAAPSIQELIDEVKSIQRSSGELSTRVQAGNKELNNRAASIAALVKGSRSGTDAVSAIRFAAKALSDAASSMSALRTTCENCIADLSK